MVGLTGGIGSGKSTVAQLLVEHGVVLIDADVLARDALDPGQPGFEAAVARFGSSIVDDDGTIDRPALAKIVFADAAARSDLNAIVHPAVAAGIAECIAELRGSDEVVVIDVPLLVETGSDYGFDDVIVVTAPQHVRVKRLERDRAMAPQEARARILAQTGDDERLKVATIVISNDGSLDALRIRVDEVWRDLVGR